MVVSVVHRKINLLQNIKYIRFINRRHTHTVCKTGVIRGNSWDGDLWYTTRYTVNRNILFLW